MTRPAMEVVKVSELGTGDRVWTEGWAHPYTVVAADIDSRGHWVMLRRWDGMRIGRVRFRVFRRRLYRLIPGASCPHCGGVQ
jgi:hypothetical protein